jgi:hypothetical protein
MWRSSNVLSFPVTYLPFLGWAAGRKFVCGAPFENAKV